MASDNEDDINDEKSILSESPLDCDIPAKRPKRIRKPNTRIFGDVANDSSMKFVTPSTRKKKRNKKKAIVTKRARQYQTSSQLRNQQTIENDCMSSQSMSSSLSLVPSNKPVHIISAYERQRLNRFGARLRNFLKLSKPYRWVCYEWFYSNLDKCLFSGDNDFCVCLREYFPRLSTRMLTKSQWNRIRQLMGRPRRCSPSFFAEERQVLYRKRDKLRKLQQRKLTHLDDISDMPKDIPMPMIIGTSITAHIEDGVYSGLYSGVIDAVDTVNSQYRITFDKQALGSRYLPDYTVMGNSIPETMPAIAFLHKERPTTTGNYISQSVNNLQLTSSNIKSNIIGENKPEPQPAIEGNLRTESFNEAHRIVSNCNMNHIGEKIVIGNHMIKLITMLVSLLVQVKIFAEKEIPSFEYVSMHKTLQEIKNLLSIENVQRCEELIDVHIRHIETGLSQIGNQPAFILEEEVITQP